MAFITNDSQLENILIEELYNVLNKVGNEKTNELRESISSKVYSYPSGEYKRTFDFLNAQVDPKVSKSKNSVEVIVGMDENKLLPGYPWYHQSIVTGEPFQYGLIDSFEVGCTSPILRSIPSTRYFSDVFGEEDSYNKLKDKIDEEIKSQLSKFGTISSS